MLAKVFPLLKNSSAVKAIIGADPVRAYRHGQAPQDVEAPYVTWFVPTSTAENTLSEVPRVDGITVQIDCWSSNAGSGSKGIETLAKAVRDAIEPFNHMIGGPTDGYDPETKRYRITMIFFFWTDRDP